MTDEAVRVQGQRPAGSSDASGGLAWDALDTVWEHTRGDLSVCVAILDGPVDGSHPSLRNARLTTIGPSTSTERHTAALRHGTHVASIIFGTHDGPLWGVAPHCRGLIFPVFKNFDAAGRPACTQSDLAAAIHAAVDSGAQVINVSAGEPARPGTLDPALADAVARCAERSVLVVAAVGEAGCAIPQIPSALPWVVPVAATEQLGSVGWSATPRLPDHHRCLLAPGTDVMGAIPGGGYQPGTGTSYASAIVSGVAALLFAMQAASGAGFDAKEVREALFSTPLPDATSGAAVLDPITSLFALTRMRANSAGGTQAVRASNLTGPPTPEPTAWMLDPAALRERYNDVAAEDFGTVELRLGGRTVHRVADLRYPVAGSESPGMRIVPASDDPESAEPRRHGSEHIDRFLRSETGLKPADPIYALVSYIRPDEHRVDLGRLADSSKLYLGHRHLAAYLGQGRTTHVLPRKTGWKGTGPLSMKWNLDRHPANLQCVSLHGVPQATLNRNAQIVDTILAASTKSPEHTWDDVTCRVVDLSTTLQYYRDAIRRADYLLDLSWYMNCAVHKVTVVNLFLNVPHNPASFRTIFSADGDRLWHEFKCRWTEIVGREFTPEDETHFSPLWELAGLTEQAVRPWTYAEYCLYQAAKAESWLDEFTGRRPLPPGVGLAWPLETLVDVIARVVSIYADFQRAGGVLAAGVLLMLRHGAAIRLELAEAKFLEMLAPVVTTLLVAEAIARGIQASVWLLTARAELEQCLKQLGERSSGDRLSQTLTQCVAAAGRTITDLPLRATTGHDQAVAWLERTLPPLLDDLRSTLLAGTDKVGHLSSPSIFSQLALGLHPRSPFVDIRTICTVLADTDLKPSPAQRATDHRLQEERMDVKSENVASEATALGGAVRGPGDSRDAAAHRPDRVNRPLVTPSAETSEPEYDGGLVYALGSLGFDFESRSRRDSIKQQMEPDAEPESAADLLSYLERNPYEAASIQWTLNLQGLPIYVIEPKGPYAADAYALLREFLQEQEGEGVERVSIPGVLAGLARHRSGASIPRLIPSIRGMYSWTTQALVESVVGSQTEGSTDDLRGRSDGVRNFLERVYYEVRNLGRQPQERALNFAATNAFEVESVYEQALREAMELDTIEVEPSPLCPPGANCWDVKLTFFFPQRTAQTSRRVYRFAVDVADVVPATVGPMRSWSIR